MPDALPWSIALAPADRRALEQAFACDGELRGDADRMLRGLVDLGLDEVFVRAFVRQLRRPARPAVAAVLPALEETLDAAAARADRRAVEEVRSWLR